MSKCYIYVYASGRYAICKVASSLKKLKFDHYYLYGEITEALNELATEYPSLAKLTSAGKSIEGRDIWVMEITDFGTGPPECKPAVWVDGNTHAGEPTGSMVCLKTISHLLSSYGKDPRITELLGNTTFYILPRVDPDGGEFVLTTPYYVLSADIETGGGRWYPLSEEEWRASQHGLYLEDIDGDGSIVKMRIPDPAGEWKPMEQDKRLMVKRRPEDREGDFYRMYPEGMILNYEGEKEIKMAPSRWGLNMGGNWPGNWGTENPGRGSGPYPLSEPETRAIADFILGHPNICVGVTYHTHGGVLFSYSEYLELPSQDRKLFEIINSVFVEQTGYPFRSSVKRRGTGGGFSSYMTVHRGIPCTTVEVWDLISRLGMGNFMERGGFYNTPDRLEEQELKLMAWNEKELGGKAFVEWHLFNHPQLGPIEVGGWIKKFLWRNPPVEFLEDEIDRNMGFPVKLGEYLPRLSVREASSTDIGGNLYKVSVTLENLGAFPTYIMQQAVEIGATKPGIITLKLGAGMNLIKGARHETFHLEGYLNKTLTGSRYERLNTRDKNMATFSWVIEAEGPGEVEVRYESPKAGRGITTLKIL
ncbi:MAG: M14 family metallopeptidase [Candidatus Bathyarchaeota archaeon]|nr:M14 family metallopeptidase [Candidatus Bathyarchaeota archaeon]